ncbi:hypothetical protein ASPWEDRAFT_39392 [Aspergillus wentii DTO 134E9]|uniref:Protamine P1 n=1 Tax=Aspergillus wentii DTO 134E9 TaxID=1073089 RepID=A0A1L9RRU3_ASPWE|nr:uncharacterized protein ASPWEDRAFT_39392 [Aspergillus wentii DTO 134E9]KAI9930503.1 hypothetical protein MW887_011257 [Aspergillus wentii]OJJ37661.1 hypothetical protein ASPWEDRAFT_39392 [Aspergillus wentii DTO 134E9]
MPLRRPASPLSLEVCPLSTSDLDSDGFIGSDDEQDEPARTAQRQRIEKLAEAYLQGTPLFILSASLKGPFEKNWVNPWKKNRKRTTNAERHQEAEPEDLVIQETDPRKRKHVYDLQEEPQESRSSSIVRPQPASTHSHRGEAKKQKHQKPRKENHSRESASTHGTPKRALPWSDSTSRLEDVTTSKDKDTSWLKKDRKQIGFHDFDPPTSPTTQFSARYSDTKSRSVRSSPLKQQSAAPSPVQNWNYGEPDSKKDTHSQVHTNPPASRSDDHAPKPIGSLPSRPQRSSHSERTDNPSEALNPETSLCVVSSSSQLPKFEYRRRKYPLHDKEHSRSPSTKSPAKRPEKPRLSPSKPTEDVTRPDPQGQTAIKPPPSAETKEPAQAETDQYTRCTFTSTRDSNAIDNKSGSNLGKAQLASHTTGGNTSDRFPSAQQVPQFPGIVDNITSLHSTVVPQGDSEYDGDTSPDMYFSTQAAVLRAQKSFQDDLESPERDHPATSARKRRASRSPSGSANSKNITPFHRLNTLSEFANRDQSKPAGAEGPPMMSTQCIIESVTPFTFSTEKKPKARIDSSSRTKSSSKKRKKTSFQMSSSPTPRDQHSSIEDENGSESSSSSPETDLHTHPELNAHSGINQSDTQTTGLPLTLEGSTLTAAQDGQGGMVGAESFNLSQAIADAGSWLQQSFDVNKEIQQCSSKKPGPSSSTDQQRPAPSLDAIQ